MAKNDGRPAPGSPFDTGLDKPGYDEAIALLEKWSFTFDGGGWVRNTPKGNPKTRFEKAEGGFYRYEREDGVWRRFPYSIHAEWEGIGGLAFDAKQGATDPNSKVKPDCFEWVNPIAWVVEQYSNEPAIQKK